MDQPVNSSLVSRLAEAPVSLSDGRGAEHFTALTEEARRAASDLAEILHDPRAEALLRGTFDGSPYLTSLATRDLERLSRVLLRVAGSALFETDRSTQPQHAVGGGHDCREASIAHL